jgi:hypothetical protein
MAPVLLLSLLLAQPKAILYAAHGDPSDLMSYEFSTWEPGHKLFIAVDQASLRVTAEDEAPVVASLTLGTPVTVRLRLANRMQVLDRVDHWYQVEARGADGKPITGYVFGNLLTPLRYEEDLDGDGEKEIATVAMTADFRIRVRVLEPSLPPPHRVASLDLRPAGEGRGGLIKASHVSAKKAGVALLVLESVPQADRSSFKAFLSYGGAERAQGTLGTVREALKLEERVEPPIMVRHSVSFDRKRRRLISVETNKGERVKGRTVRIRHVYQWRDGVYTEVPKKRR